MLLGFLASLGGARLVVALILVMVIATSNATNLTDGADGLADAPTYEYLASIADNGDALKLALDRVRQLSAHEVGHTLGFPHNYIGSAHGRMTVMDYPAPLVKITAQGTLDLSDAYPQKIGDYDKVAITWLYQDFPAGTNEPEALKKITEDALKQGITFMGYTNNNFIGAAHQFASVWDNGANLVDQLQVELKVREIGLSKFGPQVLRPGEPMSKLEFVLLPLYMHHRFQLRSAAQSLGGADYAYALRGDGQKPFTIVPGAEQRRALDVLLSTLAVDFTAIPERIVQIRQNRLLGLRAEHDAEQYVDRQAVAAEIASARKLCGKHNWPIIDVTRRSIEETAAEIIALLSERRRQVKIGRAHV